MKIVGLFSLIALSIFSQNIVLGQTVSTDSSSQTHNSETDLIHFGDLIDVDVVGSTEYDWRGTITPEGFLQGLDYIEEPVYALCQNEETVAKSIAKGYSKLLKNPVVKVKILDRSNRPTSVIYGAVKTEQRFQIKRSIYLNELIIFSGGFTENASGTIQIFRPANLSCNTENTETKVTESSDSQNVFVPASQASGAKNIDIKISELLKGLNGANPQILSGDIITVFAADPVYVIGGVAVPKQVAFRSEMTLSRAIASAGGLSKDADGKSVTIFRRDGKETKIIEADYEKIDSKTAEDISLQAFDVVEVAVKGRGKSKFPPVVRANDSENKKDANLPLRIID